MHLHMCTIPGDNGKEATVDKIRDKAFLHVNISLRKRRVPARFHFRYFGLQSNVKQTSGRAIFVGSRQTTNNWIWQSVYLSGDAARRLDNQTTSKRKTLWERVCVRETQIKNFEIIVNVTWKSRRL